MTNMEPAPLENEQWAQFKQKAEKQKIATRGRDGISDEEKEKIFFERAQSLKIEKGKTTEDEDLVKVISFHVAGEFFGIEVKCLQEVYEVSQITRIPCTPKVLVGLINYRGAVLTIINLRVLFNLNGEVLPDQNEVDENESRQHAVSTKKILIVESLDTRAGIVIDKLDNLLALPKDAIKPVSAFFRDKNKIVKSEAQINASPLLLIDSNELLNDERLIVNEDV